jgi:predicted regulator of Ras-like GTPase activity (Roadblock/LC7/MglB family)
MGDYASALEGIGKLDGIQCALLISKKGEILESVSSAAVSKNEFIPFALKTMESSMKVSPLYGKGESGQQYIEFQDIFITLDKFSQERYLILIGQSGMNLGRIRYEIKRSRKLLEEFKT